MNAREKFLAAFCGVPAYRLARVMYLMAPLIDLRGCSKRAIADAWALRHHSYSHVTIEHITVALKYPIRRENQKFTLCPDCGKKGVSLKLRERLEDDNESCRFCSFLFYTSNGYAEDRDKCRRWVQKNPEHRSYYEP